MRGRRLLLSTVLLAVAATVAGGTVAVAQDGDAGSDKTGASGQTDLVRLMAGLTGGA